MGITADIGLDAALPNIKIPEACVDPSSVFNIRPDLRHWDYRGDRDVIGFDPAGRMLYLGKTHAGEDVWIVMAPNECFGPDGEVQDVPPKGAEPARMDRRTANVMWAYISYVFTCVHYLDFAMADKYPDIRSESTLALSTDIL